MSKLAAALVLSCAFVSPALADDAGPKKVALLVGVEEYLKPGFDDLNYCEDDVEAVGKELQKLGFDVTVLLGSAKESSGRATKANIEATARRLVVPLGKKDLMLLMLSGHGQTLNPDPNADPNALDIDQFQSYYCPYDAQLNDAASQVALNHLLDDILATNVGRKLLVLDACRDIPLDRGKGARNARGIDAARIDLRAGTSVYLSCSFGQRSFEKPEVGHGLFTWCLLDGLRGGAARDGELAWADLVAHVNRKMRAPDVLKLMPPNERQVPQPAGDLTDTVLGRMTVGGLQGEPLVNELPGPGSPPVEEHVRPLGVTVEQMLRYRPVHDPGRYAASSAIDPARCRIQLVRSGARISSVNGSAWVLVDEAGRKLREFLDTDGDNVVNEWSYFLDGIEVYRDTDTNRNNEVDQSMWFANGAMTRRALDVNEDGKIDSESVPPVPLVNVEPRSDAVLPPSITSAIGLKLNLIPAGTFQMGGDQSPEEVKRVSAASGVETQAGSTHEQPQHTVQISQPFYLGIYEVTQSQWQRVMGSNPSYFSATGGGKNDVQGLNTSECPVEKVTWYDAIEFCNKLSERDGLPPYYALTGVERRSLGSIESATFALASGGRQPAGYGYRLPTEAEWEYACRAGTTTPFHFGASSNGTQANIDGNYPYGTSAKGPYLNRTTSVGKYTANAFGLYDMHGNVYEWCFDGIDWNAYKSRSGVTSDPVNRTVVGHRVVRGGYWYQGAAYCRSAERSGFTPAYRLNGLGFRVARTP